MQSSSVPQGPVMVACGADAKYSMSLAVTLYSLLTSMENRAAIELYVVDGGMGEENMSRLRRVVAQAAKNKALNCRLHLLDVEESVANTLKSLPQAGQLNYTVYLRLLLPILLPTNCEKVIYVDSDMMFLENIEELWKSDVSHKAVLAVQDYMIQTVSSPLGLGNYAALGYGPDHVYFNSGLLVINLKRWRDEQVLTRVMSYNQERRECIQFADQDGLNAVLGKDCGLLDLRWNVTILSPDLNHWSDSALKEQVSARFAELCNYPAVVHYAAGSKPWLVGNFALQRSQWYRFLRLCGWFTPTDFLNHLSRWTIRYACSYAGNMWQKGVQKIPFGRSTSFGHSDT